MSCEIPVFKLLYAVTLLSKLAGTQPCSLEATDARTLAELGLPQACREVVEKDADAVLDEVEATLYTVAATILQGEGFSYDVPSRSKVALPLPPRLTAAKHIAKMLPSNNACAAKQQPAAVTLLLLQKAVGNRHCRRHA